MNRIQAGWRAWKKVTGVMCDKIVPGKVKGRMYKTMVRPAMLYGVEAVAMTQGQEHKMQVAEMKISRWSVGLTRLDKARNEKASERMVAGEVREKLRETRLRWLGHVGRRNESYVDNRVRRMKVGKRKRGRQRKSWEDCVKDDLETVGLCEEEAIDRNKWRSNIHTSNPK